MQLTTSTACCICIACSTWACFLWDCHTASSVVISCVGVQSMCSYTSRATATQFEVALDTWETAAAAVLQREGILQQLMQLRAAMQTQQQRRTNPDSRRVSQDVVSVMLGGLDINQIHQLLWAFLAATEQVKLIAQRLQDVTGQPLLMKSVPYPPVGAVMAASHLQPIMDEAWGLLGCDWV